MAGRFLGFSIFLSLIDALITDFNKKCNTKITKKILKRSVKTIFTEHNRPIIRIKVITLHTQN